MLRVAVSGQRGASLIEIAAAMALLAILSGLAMPAYHAWTQNMQVRAAAESVLSGLQLARAEALRRNASVRFELRDRGNAPSPAGPNWAVGCVTVEADCPAVIQSHLGGGGRKNASLAAKTEVGDAATAVDFDAFGRTAGSDAIARVDVAAGDRPLRVRVKAGGETRLCDPNAPNTDPRACS